MEREKNGLQFLIQKFKKINKKSIEVNKIGYFILFLFFGTANFLSKFLKNKC